MNDWFFEIFEPEEGLYSRLAASVKYLTIVIIACVLIQLAFSAFVDTL